jgi:hypothetical protein
MRGSRWYGAPWSRETSPAPIVALLLGALTIGVPGGKSFAADDAPVAAWPSDPIASYFDDWFDRVDRTQAEQPRWMTPVATTTPRLEEEFRYDQDFEKLGNGGTLDNFGGGKGLELIPAEPIEVIVGVPPYIEKSVPGKSTVSGFNDWPFLLIKYRLLSANEQSGNYIVTAFLQGGAPTGIAALTENTYLITPTIAGGFGIGDFDIQSTLGISFPTDYARQTGDIVAWNTAFQYHLWNVLWPELEINQTYWLGGERAGKHQIFLTPGIVLGRIPLAGRAKLSIGAGYQLAVSPDTIREPLTPQYRDNFILSARVSF